MDLLSPTLSHSSMAEGTVSPGAAAPAMLDLGQGLQALSAAFHETADQISPAETEVLTIDYVIAEIVATVGDNFMELISSEETTDSYICDTCNKAYSSKRLLKSHMIETHLANKFPCKTCNKTFTDNIHLNNHIKNNNLDIICDTDNPFICVICGEEYMRENLLKKHESLSHTELFCNICGQLFVNKHYYTLHHDIAHSQIYVENNNSLDPVQNITVDTIYYEVQPCRNPVQKTSIEMPFEEMFNGQESIQAFEKESNRINAYKEITRSEESNIITKKNLPSQKNSNEAITEAKLSKKTNKINSKQKMDFEKKKNDKIKRITDKKNATKKSQKICTVCSKQFSAGSTLNRHMKIHNGEKQHKCEKCDKEFTQKSNMLSHHQKVHSDFIKPLLKFTCEICSKTLSSRNQLNSHVLNVHATKTPKKLEDKYACKLCNKTYSGRIGLNYHMRKHNGVKKFTCDVCGQSFSRNEILKRHLKIHTGVKAYSCKSCAKTFTHSFDLKNHSVVHSKEKPYECAICSRTFARKFSLAEHIQRHSGEKPFKCKLCDKPFVCKRSMQKHIKMIHNKKKT